MLLGTVAHAQESTLPKNVEQAFTKKYPNAEKIDSYEDNGLWVVVFQEPDAENTSEAFFTPTAEWEKTQTYMDESALPETLKNHLTKKYKDFYYSEVKLTETATETYLEVTIDTDTETFYVKADKAGNVLEEKQL